MPARPETTGYTAVPVAAAMSIPLWNVYEPGVSGVESPSSLSPSATVRGSPKKPRIGCCRSNGLTGQW